MSSFKKAERSQTKLRMAINGPSGSGKTLSALKIARGLVGPKGKIAVIDTENGSASYYAGPKMYEFDSLQMSPPYLVKKYIEGIGEAEAAGYDCIIIDSLSHAWAGEGGILQRKEAIDARGGNSFTNWGKMTPEQNALVNAVLHSKSNIICTMRTKTEYTIQKNDKGKDAPKKIGLAPVQREGFEYEFDIVFDIDLDTHTAQASKDRTGVFSALDPSMITEKHGQLIKKWQESGSAMEPAVESVEPVEAAKPEKKERPAFQNEAHKDAPPPQEFASEKQINRMLAIGAKSGWSVDDLKTYIGATYQITSRNKGPRDKYEAICNYIEQHPHEGDIL